MSGDGIYSMKMLKMEEHLFLTKDLRTKFSSVAISDAKSSEKGSVRSL